MTDPITTAPDLALFEDRHGAFRSLYLERLLAEAREAEEHARRLRARVQEASERLARHWARVRQGRA